MYKAILYIHVMSAILSIGPFFLLLPLVGRMSGTRGEARAIYIAIFRIATRLAKHAGHVLVASGVILIWSGPWTWDTPWIVATLLLLLVSLYFIARAFTPILRRLETSSDQERPLLRKLLRSIWIYLGLLALMLWFMVTKPSLSFY